MHTFRRLFTLILLAGILLSACNFPTTEVGGTVGPEDAVNTAAAQTVIAMSTDLAAGVTRTPGPATNTPVGGSQPSATVAPSNTPPASATATDSPDSATVCDRVRFVEDVTVPDDTEFEPGETFTKTWRLRNAGTCTWTTAYKLVFDSGDAMGGQASMNLPSSVAPGQEIELSVNLKAPTNENGYIGYWKLENASGQRFGLGDGNKAFWVKIEVNGAPDGFAVTSMQLSTANPNVTAGCPYRYIFNVQISVSSAGTVKYHFERNDGTSSPQYSTTFTSSGTQTVTAEWEMTSSYNGLIRTYIDEPNHQYLGQVNINLVCN
jgi:hypothetical protein